MPDAAAHRRISLWLKIPLTLFVVVLVPVYWIGHGPANFLWFSDIALFTTCAALWLDEHPRTRPAARLLVSMMAVGVLLLEIGWTVSFLANVLLGYDLLGLAFYMVNPAEPLHLRIFSGIFHLGLPPLLIWSVYRLGYDRRAWLAQTLLACIVLPTTRLVSTREANINWVYGFGSEAREAIAGLPPLLVLMVGLPLLVYLPTHLLLIYVNRKRAPKYG